VGAVAGIELPKGNPGAVESAAGRLTRAAGDFASAGRTIRQGERGTFAWRGIASLVFSTHCGTLGEAAGAGADACREAAQALRSYGHELEDARERVRDLQRKGEDCVRRIGAAEGRAALAGFQETTATLRGLAAALTSGPGSAAAQSDAARDAQAARDARAAAQREADAARAELHRLQDRAEQEREQVERKARAAAAKVRAAEGHLPTVEFPAPPPAPQVKEEDGGGVFGRVLGAVHVGLDGLGFVPAAGAIPDLVNAGIYGLEGKGRDAAWSLGAAVPFAGDAAKGGKIVKEGVEAATKAGRVADDAAGVVRIGDRALPAFTGKTEGILRVGDEDVALKSGYDGPSAQLPKPRPGMHGNILSHVEAHAAAVMRLQRVNRATLYINRIPCTGGQRAPGCHLNLPRMLPEGAELTVYGPDGFKWVYRGLPD
jgi:SCP1.201-like deaminase